jgi:hypothetical protein
MAELGAAHRNGMIACVQCAGERYYFLCKLSLEPALTERENDEMGTYVQTETVGGTQD